MVVGVDKDFVELEHAIAGKEGVEHMTVRGEHGIGVARQNI